MLVCSCCGAHFKDWKNQENEGANCKKCTVSILRKEVKEIKKSISLLCENLSEENKIKLLQMPFFKQRIIVYEAFEDGILSYKIN